MTQELGQREIKLLRLYCGCQFGMTPQAFYARWGVTHAQIAQICGVSEPTVDRWFASQGKTRRLADAHHRRKQQKCTSSGKSTNASLYAYGDNSAHHDRTAKSYHRDRNHFPCARRLFYGGGTLNSTKACVIEISLEKRCLHIDRITGAIAQAAYSRSAMKPELLERLEQLAAPYAPLPPWSVRPNTIRALVRCYSEQAAFYPLEEMAQWLAYQRYGLFLLPGYQPLLYLRTESKAISPNKSAIVAIGEAYLGLIIQYLYKGRLLARPVADYSDAVCGNPTDNIVYLGEAKATAAQTVGDIKRVVDGELPRFIPFVLAANSLDHTPAKVLGLLVGTTVLSSDQFH